MELNPQKNGCACRPNYYEQNGYCIEESQSETINSTGQTTTINQMDGKMPIPTISIKDAEPPSSTLFPAYQNVQLPLFSPNVNNILPTTLPSDPNVNTKPISSYFDG
jgi:hypothetical protein